MIPFYKHSLNPNKNYLKKTLASLYLTSGPVCEKIEKILKKRFGKKYCIMTNSWTNALIAILKAIKIKKDDEIIIPACTFVACANVIEMIGGKVIFADIDKDTKLLNINDCISKITKKTKIIMPVHLYGNLFSTFELKKRIKNKNIKIIEDCAHTFYGEYNNKKLGYYSDFSVFSFYATKNITCGEGGAIITNEKNHADKIRSISNNGMTKPAFKRFQNKKYIPWDVYNFGFKANLSDINASLLEDQINNYYKINSKRKKLFKIYKKAFKEIKEVLLPKSYSKIRDYYLFPVGVESKYRDKLIEFLLKNEIFVTVNFRSITELSYYKKKYKNQINNCPESIKWGRETLSLPFHIKIKLKEIKFIVSKIKEFFEKV